MVGKETDVCKKKVVHVTYKYVLSLQNRGPCGQTAVNWQLIWHTIDTSLHAELQTSGHIVKHSNKL